MKEGWTYKKLGEVCDFEGGSQPPKSEWINNPKDGYVRMLQIRDFTKSRKADVEYVKLTKKLRLCKSDDILIGRYGASVGKILTGLEGAYNVAIIKTIPDETQITKGFIRRYFESSTFQQLLQKVCVVRTAQAGFSKDDINDTLIPIPSLFEQQSIVSRLDSAFAHIDELKANAEKQLSEARALFQKALTKAMEPKVGWEEKTIGEIFKTYAGGTPLKSGKNYYEGGNIPWIRSGEVCKMYIKDCEMYITEEGMKNSSAKYYPINTVLVAMYGATAAQVGILKFEATSNQAVCGILPHKDFVPEFVYYWFTNIQKDLAAQAQGGAQPNLSQVKIKKVLISYPPLSEQQRIVSRLDSLSTHVRELEDVLQKTIAECDALKQALLRKVFE